MRLETKDKEDKSINNSKDSNDAHYNVGKDIREDIIRHNGVLPEKYPTPKRSIKNDEIRIDNIWVVKVPYII